MNVFLYIWNEEEEKDKMNITQKDTFPDQYLKRKQTQQTVCNVLDHCLRRQLQKIALIIEKIE